MEIYFSPFGFKEALITSKTVSDLGEKSSSMLNKHQCGINVVGKNEKKKNK